MVRSYLEGMRQAGMIGCVKHFPGHGNALHDTHLGYAESMKTWEEMLRCEMVPFRAAIDWGCRFVMTAHISAPAAVERGTIREERLDESVGRVLELRRELRGSC